MNALISSKSGTPFPKWMTWLFLTVGLLLAADGLKDVSFHKIFVGACCAYGAGYKKKMYLDDEGIIRESGSWFASRREVFPWGEVTFVTLARRGKQMMAFFERGDSGWKLAFDRDQQEVIEVLVRDRCPEIEVDIV